MAQLERSRKSSDSSKTPKGQHSPTFQQLIQGDVWQFHGTSTPSRQQHSATATPSRQLYSATTTPSRQFSAATTPSRSPADHEEDFSPPNSGRKSVFSKVKEKAKKLRQSLSMKKRHGSGSDHSPTTPSWGVSLEDETDDEVDEDPEFLGAPMYESEQAPEALKESARQNPRAVPVVPQNHVLPTPVAEKQEEHKAADSDATQDIASKISGLTVSVPEQKQKQTQTDHNPNAECSDDHQSMNNNDLDRENPEIGESISPQKWDKGVSVKEYFLNKLEPGEDDKALSQVISEVMSPRKGISPKKPSGEMGVVEKVREAVTSFLRHEEPSSSSSSLSTPSSRLSPRSMSTSPQPSSETAETADRNSPSNKTNSNKVPSPNSISITPTIASSAAPLMSKKSTSPSSSSSAHKFSNTDVSPKSISKKDKPYVPISLSTSCAEEPSRQTAHAKGMSVRKNVSPNSISATRVQPGEHPSMAAIKATKAAADSTNNSCRTAPAQQKNIAFSANRSAASSGPMSRSKSLSAHMPVPNDANSSPIIPVSSNAREVTEEEAHGRILQMN